MPLTSIYPPSTYRSYRVSPGAVSPARVLRLPVRRGLRLWIAQLPPTAATLSAYLPETKAAQDLLQARRPPGPGALQGTCMRTSMPAVAQIPVLGSAHWHGPVTKRGASGTASHGTAPHPRKLEGPGPLATSSHLPAGVHTGDSGPGAAFECPIQVSHDARLLLVVPFILSRHWQRVILRKSAHQLYLDPCTDSQDVRCYPRTRSIQRLSQWNSSLSLGRITDGTGTWWWAGRLHHDVWRQSRRAPEALTRRWLIGRACTAASTKYNISVAGG